MIVNLEESSDSSASSKSKSVLPFSANSMDAFTKSLIDSPIWLHLSRNSSCNSVGIRVETVLDNCLTLFTTVSKILINPRVALCLNFLIQIVRISLNYFEI